MLRLFENKKASQPPEQSQVQLLPVLGSLPEGKDIEMAYSEPGDEVALIYKTEKNIHDIFRIFDSNTLTCIKEIDLQDKKPASGNFSAWQLPNGRYTMSLYYASFGSTYSKTCVINPADNEPTFFDTRLTNGKHLNAVQHGILSEEEIFTYNSLKGMQIFNLNNLMTPCVSYSNGWEFGELAVNCLHKFEDTMYALLYKKGFVRFYERQGNEFKDINKVIYLANESNEKAVNKYSMMCFGSLIVAQVDNKQDLANEATVETRIYQYKRENNEILLTQLSNTLLPHGKFVGGYLLNTQFARLIMFTQTDIYAINPQNGTKIKIYTQANSIKNVVLMKNKLFVQYIDSDKNQHVEAMQYESVDLKNSLTQLIKKEPTLFPSGVAAICADYVGIDIAPLPQLTP